MLRKFITETKLRLQNESPKYFKKINRIGTVLVTVSLSILTPSIPEVNEILNKYLDIQFSDLMPDIFREVSKYMFGIGVSMKAVSKTAVTNPEKVEKEVKEVTEEKK
jgi:hypothetical protein